MTEDEAKSKWCPHVVASHTDPRAAPSQYEREAGATSPFRHNCIGSACMAWRVPHNVVDQDGYGIPNTQGHGYCGLAGVPQ